MRSIRKLLVALAAVVSLVAGVSTASGGGWAVTTLDPITQELVPGRSVLITYTIRQHGLTPADVGDTGIDVHAANGTSVFYPGRRKGAAGSYFALVTVPDQGATWTVLQGWAGRQDLGAVPVGSSPLTAPGTAPAGANEARVSADGSDPVRWILLFSSMVAAMALAAQVAVWRRRPATVS